MVEVVKEGTTYEKEFKKKEPMNDESRNEESFQHLVKLLGKLKTNLPIREMLHESHYCVNFLKDLLLRNSKPTNDKVVAVTKGCCTIFEDKPPKKMEDPI